MNIPQLVNDNLIPKLLTTKQVDNLYVAIAQLMEMYENEELSLIIDHPSKSEQQKNLFVEKILSHLPSEPLGHFLKEVIKQEGVGVLTGASLPGLLNTCQQAAEGLSAAKLSIAFNLKAEDLEGLVDEFSQQMGKRVIFQLTLDKRLLGGAIIQYGNYIHDYSLRSKLNQFKSKWKKAVL